jgi:serine/threonine protein kinase
MTDPYGPPEPLDEPTRCEAIPASSYDSAPIYTTIGPYRIERELGRGGMGVVYLASRSDNQYYKQVAIKLLHASMQSEDILRRFRSERQILASLEHPNIARLIEGGSAAHGEPYIVMEYVRNALPLHRYCREHDLGLAERVRLFQKVCAAVQYAHAHLVIHRDLKPSNILITEEGEVKLVDFGIAKLMLPSFWPQDAPQTQTGMQAMTPEYASPEQVRGEAIGVASDVYTLGVLLYELLAGDLPFRREEENNILTLMRRVLEEEPVRPSTRALPDTRLARELEGDLDNIILMALRKEPDRRYSSAEQLSEDLRRYLSGLPVKARPATFSYRSSKFLLRNRALVAAAALLLTSLVGGIVSTTRQATRAESLRRVAEDQSKLAQSQATEAARQRQRAEALASLAQLNQRIAEQRAIEGERQRLLAVARASDVRKIAGDLIFKVDEQVRHLNGSVQARRTIAETASLYLERLVKESAGDAQLLTELASNYVNVSRVYRSKSGANLGDTASAEKSLRRAAELLVEAEASGGDSAYITGIRTGVFSGLGDMRWLEGDSRGAMEWYQKAYANGMKHPALSDLSHPFAIRLILQASTRIGELHLELGQEQQATQRFQEAADLTAKLLARTPNDLETLRTRWVSLERLASNHMHWKRLPQAHQVLQEAITVVDRMEQATPPGAQSVRNRLVLQAMLGRHAEASGNHAEAIQHHRKQLELAERVTKSNSSDFMAAHDLVFTLVAIGRNESLRGNHDQSITQLRRAIQNADALQRFSDASVQVTQARLNTRRELAESLEEAKRWPDADTAYLDLTQLAQAIAQQQSDGAGLREAAHSLAVAGDYFLAKPTPDPAASRRFFESALASYRKLKDPRNEQELTQQLAALQK